MINNVKQCSPYQSPQICTHMSKLSKKNIQSLIKENDYNDELICKGCQSMLKLSQIKLEVNQIYINVCLHCGMLFCGNQKCVKKHQKDTHLFWGSLLLDDNSPSLLENHKSSQQLNKKSLVLHCKICGNIDNQLSNPRKQQKAEDEQKLNKLKRFLKYVHQNLDKQLLQLIVSRLKQQNNQKVNVFGLRNIGNTCFLNTVLQILYNTKPFNQLYINFQNRNTQNVYKIIAKDKKKKKLIQHYYDCYIDKYQAQRWHVVVDKKTKSKYKGGKKQIEKFVPKGIVKDYKFNKIFCSFIVNISNSILEFKKTPNNKQMIFEPVQILSAVRQLDNRYTLNQQQDAQELLILIIDMLSQGQMLALMTNNTQKQKIGKIQNLLGRQKLTPMQQIFGSYLASRVSCNGCGQENWTTDFTYHFPISLKYSKQQIKIAQNTNNPINGINYYKQLWYPQQKKQNCKILQPLFHAQKLTLKQNFYTCQKCQSPTAIKKFYIVDPPQICIISFKRFEQQTQTKINQHVSFEEIIDINDYVLINKNQNQQKQELMFYQLYGIIVHKGLSISSGHYTCFIKIFNCSKQINKCIWYEFSDQKVRRVSWKEVARQEAYMLFYQKSRQQL